MRGTRHCVQFQQGSVAPLIPRCSARTVKHSSIASGEIAERRTTGGRRGSQAVRELPRLKTARVGRALRSLSAQGVQLRQRSVAAWPPSSAAWPECPLGHVCSVSARQFTGTSNSLSTKYRVRARARRSALDDADAGGCGRAETAKAAGVRSTNCTASLVAAVQRAPAGRNQHRVGGGPSAVAGERKPEAFRATLRGSLQSPRATVPSAQFLAPSAQFCAAVVNFRLVQSGFVYLLSLCSCTTLAEFVAIVHLQI